MFLLVSVRHVGAHPGEHQHGVSIQISISLGKMFLRIYRIQYIPLTWILARVFAYLPPFICQILDFIYWTVLIFILIYFEWHDTENQQLMSQSYYQSSSIRCWQFNFRITIRQLNGTFYSLVPLGSTPELPAETCKEIKASEGEAKSKK